MVREAVERAHRESRPVRLHARDGEVVVARILGFDAEELRFIAVTSSRPENYAVCDSTGFVRRFDELERAVVLESKPRGRRHR
ncbi:MAG TPA: hypothetical protein VMR31_07255 [Myxococcota bacterium]|nr:hypothetical protein [Myxococcota bacterium]